MQLIPIKGVIVPNQDKWIYDWFEMDAVCPNDVIKKILEAGGDDITFEINSPGGEIGAGSEMWYNINAYKGRTTADIVGYACSAASYLCMGADQVRMAPTGLMMIHNVSGGAAGDKHMMEHEAGVLQMADQAISNAYRMKTGLKREEILDLMDHETWMDAVKAKELGFIDEIIGDSSGIDGNGRVISSIYNSFGGGQLLSDEVKQKMRNMVKDPAPDKESDFLIQARLNLIKIGGYENV